MIAICKMCSERVDFEKNRSYKYENGELFVLAACDKCCIKHYAELVSK